MLATGPQSVCTKCHSTGNAGYTAAGKMEQQLKYLDDAISRSDEILNRAESSGMEVSQARLDQDQARDSLTRDRDRGRQRAEPGKSALNTGTG